MWQHWVNVVAGAWLIVSSFIPSLHSFWNMIITGAVVLIIALWGALTKK